MSRPSTPNRHRRRRSLTGLLLLPLLLATAACGDDDTAAAEGGKSSSGEEIPAGVTIRVGEQAPTGELSFELSGLDQDLPYKIEYVHFDSGPLTNEGFAAGEIDVGSLGDTPAIGAAARDLPVKVLATTSSDGPGSLLVARPGSGIKELEDLEGKKVAFTTGTAQQGFTLRALDSVGLKQADVEQVDVPLQDLPSVLESGDADASVISYEAEVTYKQAHPDAIRLTSASELPGAGGFHLVADEALADEGKEAAIYDYLERRLKAQEWINTHPDIWIEEFYVKERKQTPENAAKVIEGTGTTRFTPITDEVTENHQHLADLLFEAGGLDAEVELSTIYDAEVTKRFNEILEEVPQS
jgi:sulfonate transport system substrate-binding protein